jgi:hypothetical protein
VASPETVRVYTIDENDDPLAGVLVRFFNSSDLFVTQNVTVVVGVEAYCEVTLDGDDPPVDYTIRMSKTGVAFDGSLGDDSKTPQAIEVYSPPALAPTGTNAFQVQGQTFVRPVATDPRLCRCSGFFRDLAGRPLANLDLHFIGSCMNDGQAPYSPFVVDGNAVLQGGQIITRTDRNGYLEIDLYKTGEYSVLLQGLETDLRRVIVPDQPSANLVYLLFPVVVSIVFDPDPVALLVNGYVDVDVTVLTSDGRTLDIVDGDVLFTSNDTSVASVQIVNGKLRVMGVAAGSTTVKAERADTSIVTIPSEPSSYSPLAVTVS